LTDVSTEAGLTDTPRTDSAIWLDYDRDGFLDLYEGNRKTTPRESILYRNGGDGRPDLYLGSVTGPNYLFLNDTQGGFRDATTPEVADAGEALGIAIGDVNNDGSLDIFQAAGGIGEDVRSLMLQNLGEGQFLSSADGAELSGLGSGNTLGAGLRDIDNDGDLDLIIADPHFLYLNSEDGAFVDETSRSMIGGISITVSFGDFGLDGFLDVLCGSSPRPPQFLGCSTVATATTTTG